MHAAFRQRGAGVIEVKQDSPALVSVQPVQTPDRRGRVLCHALGQRGELPIESLDLPRRLIARGDQLDLPGWVEPECQAGRDGERGSGHGRGQQRHRPLAHGRSDSVALEHSGRQIERVGGGSLEVVKTLAHAHRELGEWLVGTIGDTERHAWSEIARCHRERGRLKHTDVKYVVSTDAAEIS